MSADWEGEREVQERMRRIEGFADMSDVFDAALDEVVVPELREQFESEGRGRWPGLAPAYERRKRKLYGERPILQATGGLARSLIVPGAAHQIREVGPRGAVFGTDLERARFHQRAVRGRTRRRILELTREFRKRVRDFVAGKLAEKLRRL